jgi:hypothetical protein
MENEIDDRAHEDQFVRYLNGLSETCGDVLNADEAEDLKNVLAQLIQLLEDELL